MGVDQYEKVVNGIRDLRNAKGEELTDLAGSLDKCFLIVEELKRREEGPTGPTEEDVYFDAAIGFANKMAALQVTLAREAVERNMWLGLLVAQGARSSNQSLSELSELSDMLSGDNGKGEDLTDYDKGEL